MSATEYLARSKSAFLEDWDKLPREEQRMTVAALWDMHRITGQVSDHRLLRTMAEYVSQRARFLDTQRGAGG